MLPQFRAGVGTPLLRAVGEDGAGRAPVGVRMGGAGAGLQVVPRLILPARTGADQSFELTDLRRPLVVVRLPSAGRSRSC